MKRLFIIMILLLVPFGMYASDNIPFYYNCQADEGDVPQEKFCEDLKASFVKIGALDFIPANSQVDAFFFTEIMPTRSEATEGYMFVSMVGGVSFKGMGYPFILTNHAVFTYKYGDEAGIALNKIAQQQIQITSQWIIKNAERITPKCPECPDMTPTLMTSPYEETSNETD